LAARTQEQDVEVWPENWAIFNLFCRLQTQWNVGVSGPTGLRYEAAYPLLDKLAANDGEWQELFDDLRQMELAALEQMSKDRAEG